MKRYYNYTFITIFIIGSFSAIVSAEPKKSTWAKIKGIFTKKKSEAPEQEGQENNRDSQENKLPTKMGAAKETFETFFALKAARKKFTQTMRDQFDMITIKLKNIDLLKKELKKTKNSIASLEKKLKNLETEEFDLRKKRQDLQEANKATDSFDKKIFSVVENRKKIEKELGLSKEKRKRYKEQLARLRADFFATLVEIPKNLKNIIDLINKLFTLTGSEKGKTLISDLKKVRDELASKGTAITEQLLLKAKAYGKKDDDAPVEQMVAVDNYVKSVLDFAQKTGPVMDIVESVITKANSAIQVADKLTLGVARIIPILKKLPKLMQHMAGLAATATDLLSDIASVTTADVSQEAAKAKALLDEAFPEM